MDYCSLPKDKHGYDNVFVIVDRLSKRPVSIPCYKTTTAKEMARLFILHVYRWKGPPDTIVSDRGGQFISEFWNEFCRILGIKLKLSTSHHPQTDGQTEIANQYMAQRLRPFVNYYQDDWSEWLPIIDFAASVLPNQSTGLAPSYIDNGYTPRTSFDWSEPSTPTNLSVDQEAAQKLAHRMEEIWTRAKAGIEHAQDQQRKQADKHRREVNFDIGDGVMVTTKDWNLARPSRKLAEQAAGPYPITKKEGNSYRLELPESIKVNPTFHPEKLCLALSSKPLEGQIPDPQPAIQVDGRDEWEVEQILAVKLVRKKLQYQVSWVGHDKDLEWYPAGDFKNAPAALRDFHAQYPDLPGPPKRLPLWLKAAENEEFVDDHEEDDRPQGWTRKTRK